ncbi:hypothetical protein [Candidatus Venteria ishoeyi]|uniref:Uncharacterized protein n=1 Tax=Candidatus Venteria ishoeyi TaxID=1899563 RepID=A0A1H6FBM4_9GAMM|nr:hypothetical protein [Candidatus Venteria ishoeyi]MDM8547257.1 hypothetical protein [Candidatus Venteria ishoeyi]SEH06405.1 Uncharacterised protein [Candidatus Venteria ishoeyi]
MNKKSATIEEMETLLKEGKVTDARLALASQLDKMLHTGEVKKNIQQKPQPKVIRDSFTIPEDDYQLLMALKDRGMDVRMSLTKGEVLRAGLHALDKMDNEQFLSILRTVEKLKPGRRKSE